MCQIQFYYVSPKNHKQPKQHWHSPNAKQAVGAQVIWSREILTPYFGRKLSALTDPTVQLSFAAVPQGIGLQQKIEIIKMISIEHSLNENFVSAKWNYIILGVLKCSIYSHK